MTLAAARSLPLGTLVRVKGIRPTNGFTTHGRAKLLGVRGAKILVEYETGRRSEAAPFRVNLVEKRT